MANRETDLKLAASDKQYRYYRYCVDEWKDWKDSGLFDEVKKTVDAIHAESPNAFERNCQEILGAALQSLAELESAGLFGPRRLGRLIAVWRRDPGEIRLTSVQQLNSLETVKAYPRGADIEPPAWFTLASPG